MSQRSRLLRALCAVALMSGLPVAASAQNARADLARARTAYNQREFNEAIAAAIEARSNADTADAAAIVLARAHLERYREGADPTDLSTARLVLGSVHPGTLDERDQVELLLAMGEALFLEDEFGAAAELLESALAKSRIDPMLTESMLEWWGSAVERRASAAVARRPSEPLRSAGRTHDDRGRANPLVPGRQLLDGGWSSWHR